MNLKPAVKLPLVWVALLLCATIPLAHGAEDETAVRPHWSFEFKGGRFSPAIDDWSTYYGKDSMQHFSASLGYKVLRQLEVGVEAGTMHDRGQGYLPLNDTIGGRVYYELYPLHVFVLLRGVFAEGQWLVPYIGGGWTRMYYKQDVANQERVKGSVDGSHTRAGVQLLLDVFARNSARQLFAQYGIDNTYLFVEQQTIEAEVDAGGATVDIGGDSVLLGVLFEF
ncbi:MAG: MXAN_2562 family outer membrane beta-barrel protein [Pseudomonadota bacterium]